MNTADTYSCSEIDGGSIYSNFTDGNNRHPNCPLKSLDQHDAEVRADERKKVCEDIKKGLEDNFVYKDGMIDTYYEDGYYEGGMSIKDMIDKIALKKGDK